MIIEGTNLHHSYKDKTNHADTLTKNRESTKYGYLHAYLGKRFDKIKGTQEDNNFIDTLKQVIDSIDPAFTGDRNTVIDTFNNLSDVKINKVALLEDIKSNSIIPQIEKIYANANKISSTFDRRKNNELRQMEISILLSPYIISAPEYSVNNIDGSTIHSVQLQNYNTRLFEPVRFSQVEELKKRFEDLLLDPRGVYVKGLWNTSTNKSVVEGIFNPA